ncbi:MAG: class I SAM-dependent methyltransferase [Candidatus Binatia bacterium]
MNSRWRTEELSKTYLAEVRGAVPSADTQIEVMLKIISLWKPRLKTIMDLGCGDGILGQAILDKFPAVQVFFVDFSAPMLEAARTKVQRTRAVNFVKSDFSSPDWRNSFHKMEGFDLVVSGFSIHHQPDDRKREIYREIYELLNNGGIFLNLEHVASPTNKVEALFKDYFIDSLCSFHSKRDPHIKREAVAKEYYNRPDKEENILAPVDSQCEWLREIGFQDVDCFFKIFELALFGGRKII